MYTSMELMAGEGAHVDIDLATFKDRIIVKEQECRVMALILVYTTDYNFGNMAALIVR